MCDIISELLQSPPFDTLLLLNLAGFLGLAIAVAIDFSSFASINGLMFGSFRKLFKMTITAHSSYPLLRMSVGVCVGCFCKVPV